MTPMHSKTPKSMKQCVGPSCMGCSSPSCMSKGGKVHEKDSFQRPQSQEHKTYVDEEGTLRELEHDEEEEEEAGSYAKGGEISGEMHVGEHSEPDGDEDELSGILGEELLDAFERKDKKAILSCIEACIASCMNKE